MKFSIIVPLYNKALYVEKAIKSVFSQTYRDWELIVVDDGSTDGSLNIAQDAIQPQMGKCRIIEQANAGVSTTRNNGVAASLGDYVCFLDADDWWAPTFLEEMYKLINAYPEAGIYGTSYYIVKNGENRIAPIALDEGFKRGYINYVKVYARFLCMPLTSITVAIKRSVFDEMQGFKPQLKLGEDFDLWIRIALKYKVAFLNKPLAYYFQDSDPTFRGIGRLYKHEQHEIYFYSEYEKMYPDNSELKQLLDNKRVYGLMKYYLDKESQPWVKNELSKIDWKNQPDSDRIRYKMPLFILKIYYKCLSCGSKLKQRIMKIM